MIPEQEVKDLINWIKRYFEVNGPEAKAIVGISGGKDSSVVATLCAKALGHNRVIGVLMPQGIQHDIDIAHEIVNFLGIKSYEINIKGTCDTLYEMLGATVDDINKYPGVTSNAPARIRMTVLYALVSMFHGRVANTCNYSETYVGWETKYGDSAGDFAPIQSYTTDQVIEIGRILGIPEKFLLKVPEDGLSGKTDEDALGFTYRQLNDYIYGDIYNVPPEIGKKIETLHKNSEHKRRCLRIPCFIKGLI